MSHPVHTILYNSEQR